MNPLFLVYTVRLLGLVPAAFLLRQEPSPVCGISLTSVFLL